MYYCIICLDARIWFIKLSKTFLIKKNNKKPTKQCFTLKVQITSEICDKKGNLTKKE